jgi:hypothetical protein
MDGNLPLDRGLPIDCSTEQAADLAAGDASEDVDAPAKRQFDGRPQFKLAALD